MIISLAVGIEDQLFFILQPLPMKTNVNDALPLERMLYIASIDEP
jgi:hypothetical protein